MSMFDFLTPQRSAPARDASVGAPAQAGPANSESGGHSGGLMGWFHSAGDWVADRWHDVTSTVSDAATKVGTVAKDVWDVASTTSVGWKDGQLTVDTDLDEVMDLMPQKVKDSLQLDRDKSENRIKLSFDHHTGQLTASSDDLAIKSVNTDKLKTGAVHLSGAKITLSNPGGGIPGLDEGFNLLGYQDKADNLQASLSLEGMQAEDIELAGKDGPTKVRSVETGGLKAGLSSQQGMPFADKGSTSAGFSVEKAVVRGLNGVGLGADELSVDHAEAGLDEGAETAFLETSGVSVKNGRQGEQSLGDASVDHARVDVRNRGGGAVFFDDAPDHLEADVAVSAAGLHDFQGADQRVGSASVADVHASWSQDAGTLSASAGDLHAGQVDTDGVDASDVDLDHVKVDLGPQGDGRKLDVRADGAKVAGLAVDPTAKKKGEATNSSPLAFSAGLGSLELTDGKVADASFTRVNAKDLSASGDWSNKGLSLKAGLGSAEATGLSRGQDHLARLGLTGADATLGLDGGLDVGLKSASLGGLDAQGVHLDAGDLSGAHATLHDGTVAASVNGANLRGLDGPQGVHLDHGSLHGGQASLHGGAVDASLGSAELDGVRAMDRYGADHASLGQITASLGADRQKLGLGTATVTGLSDSQTQLRVGTAELGSLSASRQNGRIEGDLGHLGLADLAYRDTATLSSLSLDGVHGSQDKGRTEAHFTDAGLSGLDVDSKGTPSHLGRLSASDGGLVLDDTGIHARVATATATDVSHADLSAGQIATHDVSADIDGQTTALGAKGVQIDKLDANNFSAEQLRAEDAQARMTGNDYEASLSHAAADKAKIAGRLDVGQATADGVHAGVHGDVRSMTVDAAHVGDVRDTPTGTTLKTGDLADFALENRPDGTKARMGDLTLQQIGLHQQGTDASLSRLGLHDASATIGANGLDASLGRLTASDARVATTLSGSNTGATGVTGVDMPKLVRSLGGVVDDASIDVNAPLRAGDIKGVPISIKKNTDLSAHVGVTDGALDRSTRVRLSENLDGPLWVGVSGAHMDDKNRLMADVSGWFDQNVSKTLNKSLGLPGDRMHDLAHLSDAVADKMEQPSAPSKEPGPSVSDFVDLDHLDARAKVGLREGTIDAGQAGSLTLDRAKGPDGNTLLAQMTGKDRFLAGFSDLLARSFNVDSNGNQLQGGPAELTDARMQATLGDQTHIGASLSAADLRDLKLHSDSVALPAEKKKPVS